MFTRLPSNPARHGELTKAEIGMFARHQLAMASNQRKKIGRSTCLLAMANKVTWEASKGGLVSPG